MIPGEAHTLEACDDCAMLVASGGVTDSHGTDISNRIQLQITTLWGDANLTLGCTDSRCEDCMGDLWFSKRPCDSCGDRHGGNRRHLTAWVMPAPEPMPDPSNVHAVEKWLAAP